MNLFPTRSASKTINNQLTTINFLSVLALFLTGCLTPPLRPGTALIHAGPGTNGFFSEIKQPENPAQSAAQNFERTTQTETPLPVGTRIIERITSPDPAGQPIITEKTILLAQPSVQKTVVTEKAGTLIGAAQKDTARELGAKLASLKGIVWVGVVLFLFGLASLVWPPLRAIIGSVTTSIAILIGGLALMVLPTLIVGNELMILGGVALGVGAWFLAHRHGQLRGELDANKNGIADRLETSRQDM